MNTVEQRKLSREQTKTRRQNLSCKVYELKVDDSHLSKKTKDALYQLFREAKYFYNYCLSQKNIKEADTKVKAVPVKVKDVFEDRTLNILSGQMKQSVKQRIFDSIKGLHVLKEHGYKIGHLKFKSFLTSIPLAQNDNTFYIHRETNTVQITKIKGSLKVNGLEQIPEHAEIACANLIKRDNDFYINITTYQEKEDKNIPEKSIGIDFGCETQLTLSNGIKICFQDPVSKQIKRISRRIDKKVNGKQGRDRGSKNRRKLQAKRRKYYEHLKNKKTDKKNKIVHILTNNFKYICFQDESIKAWQASGHGKKIQNSGIGGLLSDLKHKTDTPIEVSKWYPSTQLCPSCGKKNKMPQEVRTYECECGFTKDRDIKSSECIEVEGIKQAVKLGIINQTKADLVLPTERRDVKPKDIVTNTLMLVSTFNGIPGVKARYYG